MCERRRCQQSPWYAYVKTLPRQHTVPLLWKDTILSRLPNDIRQEAAAEKEKLLNRYRLLEGLLSEIVASFPDTFVDSFTLGEFLWAWVCVNTRCIHLSGNRYCDRSVVRTFDAGDIALAPFLDLFNHSPSVQVEAGFDELRQNYVIRTLTGCAKYQEVFINYGPHSNKRLLLDYGFIVDDNPHDSYALTLEDIRTSLHSCDAATEAKFTAIREKNLNVGLLCTNEGLSWNLKSALLLLTADLRETRSMNIYLQQNISADHERRTTLLARELLTVALRAVPRKSNEDDITVQAVGDNVERPVNDKCCPLLLTDDLFTIQMADKMCRIYIDILQQCLDTLERF